MSRRSDALKAASMGPAGNRTIVRPGYAVLVLLANLAWEMAQSPLYKGMSQMPFWSGARHCFAAAAADLLIFAIALGVTAVAMRKRHRLVARTGWSIMLFTLVGLAISLVVERWALKTGRWSYGDRMPQIMHIGLAPLLQWLVLQPGLVLLFHALEKRRIAR